MDSLTQIVLGAAAGVAVAGRAVGPRKAALLGAVLGTLPDLDVLVPFADPVDSFILHRSASHSLVVQALVTPLIGIIVQRLLDGLRQQRAIAWATVYLCLSTHALLDAFTIYGTQLLWPISTYPFGIGSVFIIDPLYTIPLLVATIWALCLGDWRRPMAGVTMAALALSTAYLGWTLIGQALAGARAARLLAAAGISPERTLATPMPFNSLLWRVIAIDGDRYLNLYLPLLAGGDTATIYEHQRRPEGLSCIDEVPAMAKLAAFSKGFYRIERQGDAITMADLRMGVTPAYVFTFVVAREAAGALVPVPPQRFAYERSREGDLDWLLAGMAGALLPRPGEAAFMVAKPESRPTRASC